PNTEDDPSGNQTSEKAEALCGALVARADGVPLWVKIGPELGREQVEALARAFEATGVRAVIATNTLPQRTPDGAHIAGVGGGDLHLHALDTVRAFSKATNRLDVIGCGGVLDGASYRAVREAGAKAVMYYSALIYRGPLAGAIIHREAGA
ncbi:MAG: hypothetical protein AAF125_23860, partial [Chloroflexota bacterium]